MSEVRKYRKRPVVIEVMGPVTDSIIASEIAMWIRDNGGRAVRISTWFDDPPRPSIAIETAEGEMIASAGDFVIKEPFPTNDRKFYPCKPEIFEATYEPVEDEPNE